MFRKLICAILILTLCFSLCACGSTSPSTGGLNDAPSSPRPYGEKKDEPAADPEPEPEPEPEPIKEEPGKEEYERAVALFEEGKFYSAKTAFEESQYGDWEERAAACVQPLPETSELWHNEEMVSDTMQLIFKVNASDEDLCHYIAVYSEENELAEKLFFRGSGTVETWLTAGNYYVWDASGREWYGEDEQFGPTGHYERMVFNEIDYDEYLTILDDGYAWTITLHTSTGDGQGVGSEETGWENRG